MQASPVHTLGSVGVRTPHPVCSNDMAAPLTNGRDWHRGYLKEGKNSDLVSYLYPNWLQDKDEFIDYFRIASESFNRFTGLVPKAVVKQNTNTIWACRG